MSQSLRQQLIEAQKTLMRQIEILRSPVSYGPIVSFPPNNRELIARLETELSDVNAALAVRGPADT